MDELLTAEIEAAIIAAGRRNIANWDELTDHDRLMLRRSLHRLAVEWLRNERRSEGTCPAGDSSSAVFPPRRHDAPAVTHTNRHRAA